MEQVNGSGRRVEDDHKLIRAPATAAQSGGGSAYSQDGSSRFVYVLSFFSALGGFLFGYDTGVVSGAMLLLKKEMNLSAFWQELLVSSTVGAAALSALAGGFLNGVYGRRKCIMLASFIFTVGGIILSVAPDKVVLLIGRLTVGIGIGIASMTVPVYIAEMSPPQLRGQLVTINTLFITGGQFIASVVDGAFSYMEHNGWRYMLGLSVVPAILQFLGFFFLLPESPRWLLQKGNSQQALKVLAQIRATESVNEEYDSIKAMVEEEEKQTGEGPVLCRILACATARRALIVGCGLQMFQQLSGINTVMYYSATILQMAGVRDDKTAIWLSAATAFTNFLFTLVGVWLVERVGRRKLTLGSIVGTSVSLSVLAVGFLLSAQASPPVNPLDPTAPNSTCSHYGFCEQCMLDPNCGFCYYDKGSNISDTSCVPADPANTEQAAYGRCSNATQVNPNALWAYNYCPTSYSWVVLLGLILYLAFFAPGMGPMPWTVNSEIYPLWARSTGNACSAGVNWMFNVLVSLTFLHVAQYLTYYGAFFLYTGLAVLGFLFVLGCLPETKGLMLEDMETLFNRTLCTCGVLGDERTHYTRHRMDLGKVHYGTLEPEEGIAYISVSTLNNYELFFKLVILCLQVNKFFIVNKELEHLYKNIF
ncbi:solute carrier family 2 member 13b isoform X2 [Silurus meridionalis]|nr:solute carrier family 2 member 13b isoform X2 [Silurus meridionalis]XP_046715193.1 solute carrier family 2 member 13b isoform X2 [Silurus meridionalis]